MTPNWKWILGGGLVAAVVYYIAKIPKERNLIVSEGGWQELKVSGSAVQDLLAARQVAPISALPRGIPPLVAETSAIPGQGQAIGYWIRANDPTVTDAWPVVFYGALLDEDDINNSRFYRISAKWDRA
jgi:hypothetical protein